MNEAARKAKIDMRARMRTLLVDMDDATRHVASVQACERLTALDSFRHALVVMLYMPLETEIDLTSAALRCFQANKTICVPRVDWERRDMIPIEVTSFDDRMDTDEHGVRAPRYGRPVSPSLIDLVVVPGLAFDALGRRLGRGGGYFDRFLARLRADCTKVGIAFDEQIVDEVPVDAWDVNLDCVVSDRRIAHAGTSTVRD